MNIDYPILDRLNNIPESEDIVGAVPYDIAAAKKDSSDIDDRMELNFKEQDELVAEFIEEQEDKARFTKADERYTPAKLTLSESLFEDYNDDPDTYNRVFEILDNIAHVSQSSMDWTDEEWTKENTKQIADIIDENNDELQQLVNRLGESLREDIINKNDFQSDIFNALADVMMKYKDADIDEVELDQALTNFADRFFADSDTVNEAVEYDNAKSMGQGHCAPLIPDFTDSIKDAVNHLSDESERKFASKDIKRYLKSLLDKKEEVERFNSYWAERYPACIDFIDKQLELIPTELLKDSTEYFDSYLDEDVKAEVGQFVYKKKRQPLADIIQDELTSGEWGYRMSETGRMNPVKAPSLGLDEYDIGVDQDSKGYFIVANVKDEATAKKVIDIANKYSRSFTEEPGDSKRPFRVKIYVDEKDFDEPFVS